MVNKLVGEIYMKQTQINFVTLLKEYKSGWVAITPDFKRVLFHGKTLKETRKKAKISKEKLYYFPAGENYSNFIG